VTDDREAAWVEVGRYRARTQAEQNALVLVSRGIACRLVPQSDGEMALAVAPADALRAHHELARYAEENWRRRPSVPLRSLAAGLEGVLVYCAVLFFLYGAPRRRLFAWDWWSAGAAQAGRIVDGEWWRTLTALGLHADLGHLASNLAFGSGLGLLLTQLLGTGLAWLAILLAGAFGNGLSALLQPATHTAVGASTAVFGALGILAALAWKRQVAIWRLRLRRWLPFAAGLMLLAFLGVGGERTDVVAHFAGFVAGAALGAALAFGAPGLLQAARAQWACGAAAFALFALAWLLALRAHG
jgi:membrane associated rhomboid family serine protease